MGFKKATKEKLKARIALDGPAGSGKTYTALRMAVALAGKGGRIAVIDTENRSASKYVGEAPEDVPFTFDVAELEHCSPSAYTHEIKQAGTLGYDVVIIDSLSHAWEGKGGALDIVDKKAEKQNNNSFAAWRTVTPMHRKMVDAILSCPCHVIATMRTKTAYELQEVDKGGGKKKMQIDKIGTKPIQREGMEYEFDLVCDMDLQHILTVSKSRCPALDEETATKPGAAFIQPLIDWLNVGVEPEPRPEPRPQSVEPEPEAKPANAGVRLSGTNDDADDRTSQRMTDPCGLEIASQIKEYAKRAKTPPDAIKAALSRYGVERLADLSYADASKMLSKLKARATEAEAPF